MGLVLRLTFSIALGAVGGAVFYYFNHNDVIINGINPVHCFTLISVGAIVLVVAVWRFETRDLTN